MAHHHQQQQKHLAQIHRVNKPAARSREYQNLRHVVPSLRRQRDVDKVEVVTEAARYIDHLHKTLIERFLVCGIPDSLKDILGTDNANELGSQHIMNLVANMARTQKQQQNQQMQQSQRQQQSKDKSHQLKVIAPISAGFLSKIGLARRINCEKTKSALIRRRSRQQFQLQQQQHQQKRRYNAKLLSPTTITIPSTTRTHHYYRLPKKNRRTLPNDRNSSLPPPSRRRDSTDD